MLTANVFKTGNKRHSVIQNEKVRTWSGVAAIDCPRIDLTKHHLVFLVLIPSIDRLTFMYINGHYPQCGEHGLFPLISVSQLLEPPACQSIVRTAWGSFDPHQKVMKNSFKCIGSSYFAECTMKASLSLCAEHFIFHI